MPVPQIPVEVNVDSHRQDIPTPPYLEDQLGREVDIDTQGAEPLLEVDARAPPSPQAPRDQGSEASGRHEVLQVRAPGEAVDEERAVGPSEAGRRHSGVCQWAEDLREHLQPSLEALAGENPQ